jgi:hypothetical protein
MERYTEYDEYGNADIIGVNSPDLQLHLDFDEMNRVTDALNRLAKYEDSGLTPERVAELAQAEREKRCAPIGGKGALTAERTCAGAREGA